MARHGPFLCLWALEGGSAPRHSSSHLVSILELTQQSWGWVSPKRGRTWGQADAITFYFLTPGTALRWDLSVNQIMAFLP